MALQLVRPSPILQTLGKAGVSISLPFFEKKNPLDRFEYTADGHLDEAFRLKSFKTYGFLLILSQWPNETLMLQIFDQDRWENHFMMIGREQANLSLFQKCLPNYTRLKAYVILRKFSNTTRTVHPQLYLYLPYYLYL